MEIYDKKNKDFDNMARMKKVIPLPWNNIISPLIVKEGTKFN